MEREGGSVSPVTISSVSSLADPTQMNNAVPTSPLLQQMGHPHSYPNLGQISNPYEQQPPGKELNKYASLKAVGKYLPAARLPATPPLTLFQPPAPVSSPPGAVSWPFSLRSRFT